MKNFKKERIPKSIWMFAVIVSIPMAFLLVYILVGFAHWGITQIPLKNLGNDLIGFLSSSLILLVIWIPIYRRGTNSKIQIKKKGRKDRSLFTKVSGNIFFVAVGAFFLWLGWQGVIQILPWRAQSYNGLFGASIGIPLGILFLFVPIFNILPQRLEHFGEQMIIGLTGLIYLLLFGFSAYFSIRYPSHMWDNIAGKNHYMSSGLMTVFSLGILLVLIWAYRATLKMWGGKLTWQEVAEDVKKDEAKK